jgi:FHA domain
MMASSASDTAHQSQPGEHSGAFDHDQPKVVLVLENGAIGEMRLSAPRVSIGRRPNCDIVIEHAAVSGSHAVIYVEDNVHIIEDLKSTNGTLVNGLPVEKRALQHLDVIEIGLHKLYYLDDATCMNSKADLERTVNYPASQVSPLPRPAANDPSEDPLADTQRLVRDTKLSVPDKIDALAAALPKPIFVLRYIGGPRSGEIVPLDHGCVTLGEPGGVSAAIIRRSTGFFLTHISGRTMPLLNGHLVGPGAHQLVEYDFITVGGAVVEFVRRPAP